MDDSTNSDNRAPRSFEPGTLDKTRRAIGPVDQEEAQKMARLLGGEVLPERSAPIDPKTLPKQHRRPEVIKASGLSSSDIAERSAALTATSSNTKPSASVNQIVNTARRIKTDEDLPALTSKDLKLMDKVMMSSEYGIKPNYGVFNVFFRLSAKNREKISKEFGTYRIKKHIEHMQSFIGTVKTFIQISPDTYKSKIAADPDLKFKFLRTVGRWTMKDIKLLAVDLEDEGDNLTVVKLIPLVKAMYHQLITVYYIGEQQTPAMIKEVYADLASYPNSDQKQLQTLAKQAITEWLYVYTQITKGMYPLLMRMCSSQYEPYPQFFTTQIGPILQFVGVTKFDLLLPEKKKKSEADIKAEKEAAAKKAEAQTHIAGKKDELVNTGLKILEQLFPEAGFMHLEDHPDMFPYFQPLYKFTDGFNMLSAQNGLQVTVVLLRVLEDFFQGCRNINFNIEADEKLSSLKDNLNSAMADWTEYREDLFEKKYGDYLRTFVNQLYSQNDYAKSQYGKEALSNMLWQTKYNFLPCFQFTQILLEKPANDSKYKPLAGRTDYLRTVFTVLARRIDENSRTKKAVLGVLNPWDRYRFDIPNTISKRLDVLLGAKKQTDTAATNANLIKYTLCIIAVLDWWINNSESPAYTTDPLLIYRVSEKDGGPEFSVPERNDQNQLFAAAVKRAVAAHAAQAERK
jgi:hypothetical protein